MAAFHLPIRFKHAEVPDLNDIIWEPCQTRDCAFLYARLSEPLSALLLRFSHGGVVKREGALKDKKVFAFLRHLAHYGEARLTRDDSFMDLWRLYSLCRCYMLPSAVCHTVYTALLTKIDPGNAVQLLHKLQEEPLCESLLQYTRSYFLSTPIECIRRSDSLVESDLELCGHPDMNCTEEQLFSVLLEKQPQLSEDVLKSCVGLQHIGMDTLMQFRAQNEGRFSDAFYMTCFEKIFQSRGSTQQGGHGPEQKEQEPPKRQHVLMFGLFPRNIDLSKEAAYTSLTAVDYSITHFCISSKTNSYTSVPPFMTCRGILTVQSHVTASHLTLKGSFSSAGTNDSPSCCLEIRVMNYKKLCTKRHTIELPAGSTQFSCEKLLSVQTFSTEGYCFDRAAFPVLQQGHCVLVRFSVTLNSQDSEYKPH